MIEPIRPEDVVKARSKIIPDEVMSAFNHLIAKKYHGKYSRFTENEIINEIVSRLDVPRKMVFDENWLNVADIYRNAGWVVNYECPGYNKGGDVYFTFKIKK